MNKCNQCLHYLVCKHTDDMIKLLTEQQEYNSISKAVLPKDSPLSLEAVCKHERHSDQVIAARE